MRPLSGAPWLRLAPIIVLRIFGAVKGLKALDVTVRPVEQEACGGQEIAGRGHVMGTGRIMTDSAAEDLIADPRRCEA